MAHFYVQSTSPISCTTPNHQLIAWQKKIKHTKRKSILKYFSLELHLPFYIWQKHLSVITDKNLLIMGKTWLLCCQSGTHKVKGMTLLLCHLVSWYLVSVNLWMLRVESGKVLRELQQPSLLGSFTTCHYKTPIQNEVEIISRTVKMLSCSYYHTEGSLFDWDGSNDTLCNLIFLYL